MGEDYGIRVGEWIWNKGVGGGGGRGRDGFCILYFYGSLMRRV